MHKRKTKKSQIKKGAITGGTAAAKKQSRAIRVQIHQQEVLALLSKLALATFDFEIFSKEVVHYLVATLGVDFAKLLELDEESEFLKLRAGYGWKTLTPGKSKIKASATLGGDALLSHKPIVVEDLLKKSKFSSMPHLVRHRVRSGMNVIIPGSKRPYGTIGVFSKTVRVFNDDDLNFLQSVANIVALAFERASAESELRRFQYMADNANIGISLVDKDGKFKYVNRVTYERLGFTKEEYLNSRKVVYQESDDKPPRFKKTFNLIQKKALPPIETFEMKKDGFNKVPLEISLTGVEFEGEQYMFAVSQDITSRIKVQSNLEFLAKASLTLGSSFDYRETLNLVTQLAVEHISDWCVIDMLDADDYPTLFAVGHRDPEKVEWAKKVRQNSPIDLSAERGVANVFRTGKPELYPLITDDMLVANAQSPEHLKLIREVGMKSVMLVPLKSNRRTVGVITFITTQTDRCYDKDDLSIAQQLADRASAAIENTKLYSEIEDQKLRLNNIIGNVPGVVWEMWVDQNPAEQRLNFISDYIETMVGYPPQEWLAPRFWMSVLHPEDRDRVREEHEFMLKEGKPIVQQFRWIHRNGKILWVESHISIIAGPHGKAIGLRGVTMDVTERMELEKRKDEFISMASHELKTPVTTLKVFTQILQKQAEKTGENPLMTYLGKMDSQIMRLTDLINDLLDLSKIQTGKLSFKPSSFRIENLVHEIVEQLQPTADHHKIVVRGSTRRPLNADRDRIGQVLINLITNAIKYSPNANKVIVSVSEKSASVTIDIEDFGIGIAKDQQKKIFDRFYQGTEGNERTFPGLGIGLYISDEIMRRHGGTISVSSSKGKGSVFRLTLPLKLSKAIHAEMSSGVSNIPAA